MLKSPSRSVDADMEQMEVSSSDSSDRKVDKAFGGRYMRTTCGCACPAREKAAHSKDKGDQEM